MKRNGNMVSYTLSEIKEMWQKSKNVLPPAYFLSDEEVEAAVDDDSENIELEPDVSANVYSRKSIKPKPLINMALREYIKNHPEV